MKLAFGGPDLGDVDMEVADRVRLELAPGRFVALDVGLSTDAVALKTAMQRQARQVRDRRLERVEAVVQRQQRVAPERNHDRRFLDRQRG